MRQCLGCEKVATASWFGDAWCDPCGGVMGTKNLLLFRHVATVDGAGGRIPVVWDESGKCYKFRHPSKVNPRYERYMAESVERKKSGLPPRPPIEAEFAVQPILTINNESLDAVLAIAQPIARGNKEEWPELSAAPTATKSERLLMRI